MQLHDFFEGWEARTIQVGETRIFCRLGGPASAPPVLLVHGYPQTHVMWHVVAHALAADFRVVLADLRGYGWSSTPAASADHAAFSKRAMAEDMIRVMETLGHVRFALVGHDRGARVGYRLALDHPGRLSRLTVLDIVPTADMWSGMDAARAMKVYHWMFLAQPAPLPETLIGGACDAYLEHTLASWTKAGDLSAFHRGAIAHYKAFFAVPERLHATCEDYRAGATIDRSHDEESLAAGRRIECPTLALWGASGIPADAEKGGRGASPLDVWSRWCTRLEGAPIDSGHFIPEENPSALLDRLVPFLKG